MGQASNSLWDQLSEDWPSQPPSSPPQLPSPVQRRKDDREALPKSRIPRFANKRAAHSESPKRPVPLTERSQSNINSRPHSSPPPKNSMATSASRSSAESSSGSVVKHEKASVERKADRTDSENEWQRLALHKQDFFSPMALEGIFQKPDSPFLPRRSKESFTFLNENADMPSSPPFVNDSRSLLKTPQNFRLSRSSHELCDIVEEQDASAPVDESPAEEPHQSDDSAGASEETEQEEEKSQGYPGRGALYPVSESSSSVAYGFSPVFISKHNTVDGKVDYAALDPSELSNLGNFVNLERGGRSDDGSFKTRPLSPSDTASMLPSDSVAPSDSVSQIDCPTNSRPSLNQKLTGKLSPIREPHPDSASSGNGRENSASRVGPEVAQISHPSSLETAFLALNTHDEALRQQSHVLASNESDAARREPLSNLRLSQSTASQLQALRSVVGKKRKDARYEKLSDSSHPLTVAKRPILRPRNPTPGQINYAKTKDVSVSALNAKRLTAAEEIRSRFAHAGADFTARDAAKARALASEATQYRLKTSQSAPGGPRKQSVSTQDYINEAMKIMELIRARKNVDSDLDSSAKTSSDYMASEAEEDNFNLTLQTISRPPSREGSYPGWRPRGSRTVDAGVLSHLKKYEETGDESFLVSSIAKSVRATHLSRDMNEGEASVLSHCSVFRQSRRFSDPCPSQFEPGELESPAKTQRSQNSSGSAETIATTSTQRIRTIATIGPENISHLIRDEEAGMRFDTQRQTWVKCRARSSQYQTELFPSSSSATDTKALNEIPDLSVNECEEQERSRVLSGQQLLDPLDASEEEENTAVGEGSNAAIKQNNPLLEPQRSQGRASSETPTHSSEKEIEFAATKREYDSDEADILPTTEKPEIDSKIGALERSSLSLRGQSRRREQSVLFSSPPVSREWDANQWTDSDDREYVDLESSQVAPWGYQNRMKGPKSPLRADKIRRARSLSRIEERHEISFTERGLNGRTLSMSLSISTPVPARRSITVPTRGMSGIARQQSLLNSLSPMSAFSINQSDEHHKRSIALGMPLLKVELAKEGFRAQWAQATEGIVRTLTDVEPNEPYWDFMSKLNVSNDGLDTLHSLDVFCPRLESLDASSNRLEHLNGVPASLRSLSLSDNALSNLTHWGQLINLQYVYLSRNNLTSLDGFNGLVHLRELVVDSNKITDVQGILDLDGLLSLSLKDNRVSSVDFETADLKRLEHLNMSDNSLECITGLPSLISLKSLDLSGNRLSSFAASSRSSNACNSLTSLDLSKNQMAMLDLSDLPSLQVLRADGNKLQSVEGLSKLAKLERLFLRDQVLPANSTFDQISTLSQVQELHLSGTPLPPCLPVTAPLLRLQTLDIAFTGIQALPAELGLLTPNLQILNINDNHVKDLRPLDGIVGLRRLHAAGNRISRLRSLVRILKQLNGLRGGVLGEVDLRGNPLVIGFYHTIGNEDRGTLRSCSGSLSKQSTLVGSASEHTAEYNLARLLPDLDAESDAKYVRTLDSDTRMKRRIYELLLAGKCAKLQRLDGLALDRAAVERKDAVWGMLVEKGIVQKVE